ncbi:restriction endonuclease [Piscinibacter defluvii]|uniref:restriction endonuclease n=1 Tax=Piscinibacter defluvii TaxID=1796922 RepID=UPI000FDE2C32|nr:restriction endonuclease [Piscinibacter defluvii]
MGRKRSSRPELVRLTPWVIGSGAVALCVAGLQLVGHRAGLGAAAPAVAAAGLGLAAAALWQWRRRSAPRGPSAVSRSRREFEGRLAEAFQSQGYQIVPGGTGGPVDLVLRRDRGTFLVHSRQWQADKVGIEALRDLQAEIRSRAAAGGFVVCQGRFSREAQRFAAGSPLRLIDGAALQQWLGR